MSARDERAVLGALVTGALTLRDVADVGDWFTSEFHASISCVLVAALECRASGQRIPGGKGIDLAWACRACELGGAWPIRERRVDGKLVGYLPDLARAAPRRQEALEVLARLRDDAEARRREAIRVWDIERDREALGVALTEVLEGAAASFLRDVKMSDGLTSPRGVARPIDPAAYPESEEDLASWCAELMLDRARHHRAAAIERALELPTRREVSPPSAEETTDPDDYIQRYGAEAIRRAVAEAT